MVYWGRILQLDVRLFLICWLMFDGKDSICYRILENLPLCHIWHLKYFQLKQDIDSTNQHWSEHRISLYHELPENIWNILRTACVLLWQQHKVAGSIHFTCDKVVDFPKFSHIYSIEGNNSCLYKCFSIWVRVLYEFLYRKPSKQLGLLQM